VGISRAIPLSNTNQLWGFAWGVLVFGELAHVPGSVRVLALAASGLMIAGAMLIAGATVSAAESASCVRAVGRECDRYAMDLDRTLRAQAGMEGAAAGEPRRWWDFAIMAAAAGVFVWFARYARVPHVAMQVGFAVALIAILLAILGICGWLLWKRTRFG
jgi:hypothetical protein